MFIKLLLKIIPFTLLIYNISDDIHSSNTSNKLDSTKKHNIEEVNNNDNEDTSIDTSNDNIEDNNTEDSENENKINTDEDKDSTNEGNNNNKEDSFDEEYDNNGEEEDNIDDVDKDSNIEEDTNYKDQDNENDNDNDEIEDSSNDEDDESNEEDENNNTKDEEEEEDDNNSEEKDNIDADDASIEDEFENDMLDNTDDGNKDNDIEDLSDDENEYAIEDPEEDENDDTVYDPLEKINRKVFKFNDTMDDVLSKIMPKNKHRDRTKPSPVLTVMNNFSHNFFEAPRIINYALQGNIKNTSNSIARLIINTALGFFGVADVAEKLGFKKNNTYFGDTLKKWGMKPGPYVVLPILGPTSLRGAVGHAFGIPILHTAKLPLRALKPIAKNTIYYSTYCGGLLATRSAYGEMIEQVSAMSKDKYKTFRSITMSSESN